MQLDVEPHDPCSRPSTPSPVVQTSSSPPPGSHSLHAQYDAQTAEDNLKQAKNSHKSKLIETLRLRFPDGPPEEYDDFIRVSMHDARPNADYNQQVSQEHAQENRIVPSGERLRKVASRAWTAITSTITYHPSLTHHTPPRPIISSPRPIEVQPLRTPRSTLAPSPVQLYAQTFNGIGPPPPLPSPYDVLDIRPQSRNTVNKSRCSDSHSSCNHSRHRVITEISRPETYLPAKPSAARLSVKNSIKFPSVSELKRPKKKIRIVTPRSMETFVRVRNPSKQAPRRNLPVIAWLNKCVAYLSRIITFQDPAQSLFLLGFIAGPQNWLLGGFYLTSMEKGDPKSQLRIWVNQSVQKTRDRSPSPGNHGSDELLDRIERASAGLTSESFEIGRRTVTNSDASRGKGRATHAARTTRVSRSSGDVHAVSGDLPAHPRLSRAVWQGFEGPHLKTDLRGDDEVSIAFEPNRWVRRCRTASLLSGIILLALFVASVTIVFTR
ncbi:hypothetical protein FRC20_002905 [Serendipita sp. 405]|nr:hypothetical protein FRC15_002196 [Serendipita sp. 397]KAG8800440.1 hypothetical protein FRC16_002875 [Serendipita sp. 398]KAG8868745.1 hypothetical protein FRC20_002905 [Serendipita sp. 405]